MSEYLMEVFGILAIIGALSLLTYGSGRAESVALAIICLYILASPLVELVGGFKPEGFFDSIKIPEVEIGSGYDAVIEDAFADGIGRAVADKFLLRKEDIRVRLVGFDSERMRAEKIQLILSGRAALADYKAVEKYIDSLSLGEGSVEIEI